MSYTEIMKRAKSDQLPRVILLFGTETFFIQNLQREIVRSVLPEGGEENLSTYDLEETPIEEVIIDAETYPFFGEKKVLIINNPVFLTAKQIRLPFEHQLEYLERYLLAPVDYSTLVFIAPYEKLDNRRKITKLLRKHALVAECHPIRDREMRTWIKNLADDLQITLESGAYDIFETELIVNLHLIQNELIKMAMYVGPGGVVTQEVARGLISQTTNGSALRLVDAVIDRNLHDAIVIQEDLKLMGEEPIGLIALLAYQFRMIYRVKLLKAKGHTQHQIQKQVAAHPYVIKIASDRVENFSTERLDDIIDLLTEVDAAIKRGKMEKDLAFELLLYDLITTR